ncbi:sensor histidine kinase [Conyzicola sp.]|uniref:sensor histidine kinase n=1 Tax=Conyzicola sp. TaxID=1969404 RepID=UPI0039894FF2
MSLGLPGHLAPHSESRAFARAAHVISFVVLVAALLIVIALQSRWPEATLWPAMAALLVFVVALWLLERYRSVVFSVLYLVVGTVAVFSLVYAGTAQFPDAIATDNFVFTLAKIALTVVGGAGIGVFKAATWCVAGYVLGETATILAALQTGATIVPDLTALGVVVVVALMFTVVGLGRKRVHLAQPSLQRAARDEQLSDIRHRIEVRAAAMLHDTILNHLAAVAVSADGALRTSLRGRIERDLQLLAGEEWLLAPAEGAGQRGDSRSGWYASRLYRSIDEARDLGLEVVLSGDPSAIQRLDAQRQLAVGLAVKQCLVNVIKHAGTDRAEVVIYGSESEVSVMIIDAGKGFSERETSLDRLGLRQSVRRRIETVDGTVQVWSTPGTGTSILLRLPAAERPESAS